MKGNSGMDNKKKKFEIKLVDLCSSGNQKEKDDN